MTNRQFIVLACRTMSVVILVRLPWFIFESVQLFFKFAPPPGASLGVVNKTIRQVTPFVTGVLVFEFVAAVVLWQFAVGIAVLLERRNLDEPMIRLPTLSVIDVQSLIFVGIGMWMILSSVASASLGAWTLLSSALDPNPGFGQAVQKTLFLSWVPAFIVPSIYILGGVALIFFARPLARFTQREKQEVA